jgi:hypothetical protein
MKNFTIVVTNVSSFNIEADTKEQAEKLANRLLSKGHTDTMTIIDEYSTGWEVTDIEDPA